MLYTIALVLLVLWVLGLVTAFTAGGLLHLLLVAAVVIVLYQLITGRRGI
ncbi:MAG: lmo0937 family membrane protein [Burkholderiales bacterium]|nr:lmo0937 family membrane protein [Burkholderiales bacterium]MDE2296836.1 lmo0937 family membrane protein [Burkholderiales bacterium]MDE2627828.1 lmo0937 family membrane protein [Burkholderiales bacterium]